ncbi:MAG: nitroreductase family protein [Alphaproteobacteria bacterium]|nr:nitroreductase family protein [Alphaproteobacteria bacterium]
MNFKNLLIKRRSIYNISNKTDINDDQLLSILLTALTYCPTAFNSQSGRMVLLLDNAHTVFWQKTFNIIKTHIKPEQTTKTFEKIQSFVNGHGTILFFDDQESIRKLQKQYPLYKNNFKTWSQQSQGILQFITWTLLAEVNIGASLQHYNPLIDQEVTNTFNIPKTWKLTAQMPFGSIAIPADAKSFIPLEKRYKIFTK